MRQEGHTPETLAILVGDGPAPGINGAIASAAITAINCGLRILGLRDGYRRLVDRGGVTPGNVEKLLGPQNGRIRVRMVNLSSEPYQVARS